ncbi:hypothetical protein MTO96_005190 [Rhipicephalus appendiculatus]
MAVAAARALDRLNMHAEAARAYGVLACGGVGTGEHDGGDEDDPRLAFCRGSAMAALGDVEPALQEFRRGLVLAAAAGEEGGDWLRSQLLVNIAVLQAPREEEASRRQLARALAICPDNVDAAYNLSLLLLAAGKTEAARRIWQQHGFRAEDAACRSSSSVGAPQAAWIETRLSQWHVRLYIF